MNPTGSKDETLNPTLVVRHRLSHKSELSFFRLRLTLTPAGSLGGFIYLRSTVESKNEGREVLSYNKNVELLSAIFCTNFVGPCCKFWHLYYLHFTDLNNFFELTVQ